MERLRSGTRVAGGKMGYVVSTAVTIGGAITLPPDRYTGTVAWKETMGRSGFERSKKRYKIELSAEDVLRWGGGPVSGGPTCLIDITAEIAAGDITLL